MPRKQPKRTVIEASSIVLRDPAGKPRITLDAGGDDGFANICLFSGDGRRSVQLGTQSGGVVMSFSDERLNGMLTISTAGLVLHADDGGLSIVVGPAVDGRDCIMVFRDGRPVWVAPDEPRASGSSSRSAPGR